MKAKRTKVKKSQKTPLSSRLQTQKPQPQTVLLAVTGMSPAVLTETLWALAFPQEKGALAIVPDRVIVLTTTEGRRQIVEELFAPNEDFGGVCVWDALRGALEKAGHDLEGKLRFGTTGDDLRVFTMAEPRGGRSGELGDIRTRAQNDAAADFIMDEVRRITFNDDTQLIASLAGGRKTMGALLYACLSLLGRPQDRLTHVLVNEPFDSRLQPNFYFPAQPARTLRDSQGRTYEAAQCHPQLADVPFVRFRRLFPEQVGKWPGHFHDLVRLYGERVEDLAGPPEVSLDENRAVAIINGVELDLLGREFPFFCFLLDRARRGEPPLPNHPAAETPFRAFLEEWAKRHPEFDFSKGGGSDWRKNFDCQDLKKPLSSLRQKLKVHGLAHLESFLFPLRGALGLKIKPTA